MAQARTLTDSKSANRKARKGAPSATSQPDVTVELPDVDTVKAVRTSKTGQKALRGYWIAAQAVIDSPEVVHAKAVQKAARDRLLAMYLTLGVWEGAKGAKVKFKPRVNKCVNYDLLAEFLTAEQYKQVVTETVSQVITCA
jgi:hypothetical protein